MGFVLNRRENDKGIDLNRQYRHLETAETRAHIAWLERQPQFDLCLCLHEDWESHGFYVYELNPENRPSLAETMIARIAEVCPIDPSEIIEDRPARNGIIRPNLDPAHATAMGRGILFDCEQDEVVLHPRSALGFSVDHPRQRARHRRERRVGNVR